MAPKKRPAAADGTVLQGAGSKKRPAAASGAAVTSDDAVTTTPQLHFAAAPAESGPRAILATARPKQVELPLQSTALICIDFQKDFLEEGGFGHALGNDVTRLAADCLPGASSLLRAARGQPEGESHDGAEHRVTPYLAAVVHTKEAHKEDLSDCPMTKLKGPRCPPDGKRVGDTLVEGMGRLLVDGSPGNDFVDSATPVAGEHVICKPGKGAFFLTGLHDFLRARRISHLVICGVTTEVCVQTTLREANDRGYECVLVEDATASYIPAFKAAVIEMVRSQGGIVGYTVEKAKDVADAIRAAVRSDGTGETQAAAGAVTGADID